MGKGVRNKKITVFGSGGNVSSKRFIATHALKRPLNGHNATIITH